MNLDPITKEFVRKNAVECSNVLVSKRQIFCYCLFVTGALLLISLRWDIFLVSTTAFFVFWYTLAGLFRFWAALVASFGFGEQRISDTELASLEDGDLPIYTILVPLYKEASIASSIITSLMELEYPKDKLDIKLLLEVDDQETQAAVKATFLPDCFEVIIVPAFAPKTKPRACNFGLARAKGAFCVIYDAEDRPDSDQLRKVVAAFKKAPSSVACIQAKLNYFNPDQNLLTRWFSIEYSTNFDLLLPGLQTLNIPLPLGGTSNHFRTTVLKEVGGWDPFNVTEDCDLGIRLYKRKYKTQVIDSTTWEEANSNLWNWLRQRSRWVKGFFQTHLTHMRHPVKTFKELGPWGFLGFYLMVGASSLMVISNLIFWLMGVVYFTPLIIGLTQGLSIREMIIGPLSGSYAGDIVPQLPLKAWTMLFYGISENVLWGEMTDIFGSVSMALLLANVLFVLVHCLACLKRKHWNLLPVALTMPIYWLLISLGGWKGLLQLFTNPFYWEKTNHGLLLPQKKQLATAKWKPILVSGIIICLALGGATTGAKNPTYFSGKPYTVVEKNKVQAHGDLDKIWAMVPPENSIQIYWERPDVDMMPKHSWFAAQNVVINIEYPFGQSASPETIVFVQDKDNYWFQVKQPFKLKPGKNELRLSMLPEDGLWEARGHSSVWNDQHKLYIKQIGVLAYSKQKKGCSIVVEKPFLEGQRPEQKLQVADWQLEKKYVQNKRFESRFSISRSFFNPYDFELNAVDFEVKTPAGKNEVWPCFYHQDADLTISGRKEVRRRRGAPFWAFRYTPASPGTYKLRLRVTDHSNGREEIVYSRWKEINVSRSANKGFVQVSDKDPRYFQFSGTEELFYPVGFNLHTYKDLRSEKRLKIQVGEDLGSLGYETFFKEMSRNGINSCEVWMAPWNVAIEWNYRRRGYFGLGRYNLEAAVALDHILELAEKYGIYIHLVLDNHGKLSSVMDPEWPESPLNVDAPFATANQAFLQKPDLFFTDPNAIKYNARRNRYIAARWGAYNAIWGIEFWSEINLIDNFGSLYHSGKALQWHKKSREDFRKWDQGRHIFTTHFSSDVETNVRYKKLQESDVIDYVVGDAYRDGSISINKQLQKHREKLHFYKKPIMVTEYGGSRMGSAYGPLRADLHAGLWSALFTRQAGTPYFWWHHFIQQENQFFRYKHFAKWLQGIDPRGKRFEFRPLPPFTEADRYYEGFFMGNKQEMYLWVSEKEAARLLVPHKQLNKRDKRPATVQLSELKGCYEIEFFNPHTGEAVRPNKAFKLDGSLTLPAFYPDIAVKMFSCNISDR